MPITRQHGWTTAAALALFLAPAAAAQTAPPVPTAQAIGIALTLDRFSDACEGPGPDEGCPMINIYRVLVRDPHCEPRPTPATDNRYYAEPLAAVACRFESAVVTVVQRGRPGWGADQSDFVLLSNGLGWHVAEWQARPAPAQP